MSLIRTTLLALSVLVLLCDGSLLYTYLHPKAPVCVVAEDIRFNGREDSIAVSYGFLETDISGSVTFTVRQDATSGPTIERILDVSESQVTVNLVAGPMYRYCFEYSGHRSRIPLEFEINRVHQNSLIDAHEDQIDTYMDLAQSIEHLTAVAFGELEVLTERQEAFESTVQSTYTRVIVLTLVGMAVVSIIMAWQLWAMKMFFRAKKIV